MSLAIETYYTFAKSVDGNYKVELFLDHTKRKPDFVKTGSITGTANLDFELLNEVDVDGDAQYADVTVNVEIMEAFSSESSHTY